jgi:phosphoribosylanthranilate isomerase
MFLKICGITRRDDALTAVECGATALGFVFWPGSPRYVTPGRAAEIIADVPNHVTTVGVFVDESVEHVREVVATSGVGTVQLHGDEPPEYGAKLENPVLRAIRVNEAGRVCAAWPRGTTFLLDSADPARRGGTGVVVDWERAAPVARVWRVVLAGGLTPVNVAAAIATVRPVGVDVSSGVEDAPGVKSADKVARFLASARRALEHTAGGDRL